MPSLPGSIRRSCEPPCLPASGTARRAVVCGNRGPGLLSLIFAEGPLASVPFEWARVERMHTRSLGLLSGLLLLFLSACSGNPAKDAGATGGSGATATVSGGTRTGGIMGGTVAATGGTVVATGGAAIATGGTVVATGGTVITTGGSVRATGGTVVTTGGAVVAGNTGGSAGGISAAGSCGIATIPVSLSTAWATKSAIRSA